MCGQMRVNLKCLGRNVVLKCEEKPEKDSKEKISRKLLSMEEAILWCGGVLPGLVLEI